MSEKEERMISDMWYIFKSFPISMCEILGEDLYREVGEYLGEFDEEIDLDLEELDEELNNEQKTINNSIK